MEPIAVTDIELTPQTPYPLATVQSQWASLTDRYIWHANNPDQFFTMQRDLRRMIIQCFWGAGADGDLRLDYFDSYFIAFQEDCNRFKQKIAEAKLSFSFTNYAQILQLVHHLKETKDNPRNLIYGSFFKNYSPPIGCSEREAYFMVDLCVLLWLRIDITERIYPGATLGAEAIWSDEKSLKAMIADQFPRASYPQTKNTFLRKWFTLERLVHYGYFRVQWTNNLREHLLVDPFQPNGIRNIYIFHHASVLKQLAAKDDEVRELDRIFPTGFLRETIDSLALLIPRAQVSINNWYSAECEVRGKGVGKVGFIRDVIFGPNGNSSNCGMVALDQMAGTEPSNKSFRERSRYLFWGGRLSSFEEVVDEAEPGRIREWLRDPRTASHRYSFWLTVLSILVAIILGVVQVALTAVQVRATNSSTLCTCIPS